MLPALVLIVAIMAKFWVTHWVLNMAYLCTKIDDCSFNHSRDMKEDPKRENWGDFGVIIVTIR